MSVHYTPVLLRNASHTVPNHIDFRKKWFSHAAFHLAQLPLSHPPRRSEASTTSCSSCPQNCPQRQLVRVLPAFIKPPRPLRSLWRDCLPFARAALPSSGALDWLWKKSRSRHTCYRLPWTGHWPASGPRRPRPGAAATATRPRTAHAAAHTAKAAKGGARGPRVAAGLRAARQPRPGPAWRPVRAARTVTSTPRRGAGGPHRAPQPGGGRERGGTPSRNGPAGVPAGPPPPATRPLPLATATASPPPDSPAPPAPPRSPSPPPSRRRPLPRAAPSAALIGYRPRPHRPGLSPAMRPTQRLIGQHRRGRCPGRDVRRAGQ